MLGVRRTSNRFTLAGYVTRFLDWRFSGWRFSGPRLLRQLSRRECHVGLLHLLKYPRIAAGVGMVFMCRRAIRRLDFFGSGRAANAKNLIRIE